MSSRAGRAAREEARARAAKKASKKSNAAPQPEPTYNTPSSFYGASNELSSSISGWLNSNKDNKAVGAAGADLFYNSATAGLKTSSDVAYAKAMAPEALKYQEGAQKIATEASNAQIAAQGKVDYDRQKLVSDADRYRSENELAGTREQTGAQRYGYDRQYDVAKEQAGAQRYASDQELAGVREQTGAQRYGYDRQYDTAKYQSDAGLTGQREGYRSQERQIGLTGEEQRKSLKQQTEETVALRRDARGAIMERGRGMFGGGRRLFA